MGNFEIDTTIIGSNGKYTANLSNDWEIWGPNGGYIAAIALRAAGAESRLKRPAAFSCQYLRVAEFDSVQLQVQKLKEGTAAEALKVTMLQNNNRILEAMIWIVADISGYEYEIAEPFNVKRPKQLRPIEELLKPEEKSPYKFWDNLDRRSLSWSPQNGWKQDTPKWQEWYRYRPQATFADPFVDAARSLLLIDTMQWPAVYSLCSTELKYLAPSLDLTVQFHQSRPESEWLFCDASSNIAHNGIIAGKAHIRSEDGSLLASGVSTLLCRPIGKH